MGTMRGKILKLTIAVLLTALLLWLLLQQVSIAEIWSTTAQLPLALVFAGFLIFAASHGIRAWRFRLLLQKRVSYPVMLQVTCMHNFFLALLPFRLGEFSFLYLLKRRKLPLTKSFAALAVGRVFDVVAISIYFLIGLWMLTGMLPESISAVQPYAITLLAVLLIGTYVAMTHLRQLLALIKTRKGKLSHTIMQKLSELLEGVELLKQQQLFLQVVTLSMLTWGLQFFWSWLVFREMLNANFWAIVVGTSLPIISTAIPIQGLAAFGTFEVVWAVVFLAFGVEKTLAIASGFAFHLINILYAAILGIGGTIAFTLDGAAARKRREKRG